MQSCCVYPDAGDIPAVQVVRELLTFHPCRADLLERRIGSPSDGIDLPAFEHSDTGIKKAAFRLRIFGDGSIHGRPVESNQSDRCQPRIFTTFRLAF